MQDKIANKNIIFKELKAKLRQSPRQSFTELDTILSGVADKKAFVFLLDSHETEKEIVREILDSLLETIMDLNEDYSDYFLTITTSNKIESFTLPETLNNIFSINNIKTLAIISIVIGIILSITLNENVALKLIDTFTSDKSTKESDK